jgi:hypothetical protein
MSEFNFKTDDYTYYFCQEVVRCPKVYCEKSHEEALQLINQCWSDEPVFDEYDYRVHEFPYYWAMCMTHDRRWWDNHPEWRKDPTLWPPPKEYLRHVVPLAFSEDSQVE